ncbi:MAG TPA: UvrB/UvrC motif-containing protein [Gemmataceae bacterium]|nr:UvrB/UvrC motif-containing protein [Gemmataceae bacterium]
MKGLFFCRRFTGFGPTRFLPSASPPADQVHGARPALLRRAVREQCPRRPGVYGMLDAQGELIYVGKAKCLRTRLASYFRPRSRDPKAGRILEHARTLAWECVPSEFAALLRELELIHRWRPRFNVQGQPGRYRRAYVCLARQPAPYAFLARRPPTGALAAFGPVPAGRRATEAVRRVNDWFGLRDCPQAQEMVFADQAELFPVLRAAGCIRHEIGTCLGPCAAGCTRAAYGERVRAARAFLDGTDLSPLHRLERDMTAAARVELFERAAALRDKLTSLRWLGEQIGRLREAQEGHSFIYRVPGHSGENLWYLIQGGRVAVVLTAPRRPAGYRTAAREIAAVFREDHRETSSAGAQEIDGVLLVAAWFRRHPEERHRTLDPGEFLAATTTTLV